MIRSTWMSVVLIMVIRFFSSSYAEWRLSDEQKKNYELISPVIKTFQEKSTVPTAGRGVVTATEKIPSKDEGGSDDWITYILTARHTLTPDAIKKGFAQVTKPIFTDGKITGSIQTTGKILVVSDTYDLALLAVSTKGEPFLQQTVTFVMNADLENEMVYTSGPPQKGQRKITAGKCLPGSHTFKYWGKPIDSSMVTTCLSRAGASGSGFFVLGDDGTFMCVGVLTHIVHVDTEGNGSAFGLTSMQIHEFATAAKHIDAFHFQTLPGPNPSVVRK